MGVVSSEVFKFFENALSWSVTLTSRKTWRCNSEICDRLLVLQDRYDYSYRPVSAKEDSEINMQWIHHEQWWRTVHSRSLTEILDGYLWNVVSLCFITYPQFASGDMWWGHMSQQSGNARKVGIQAREDVWYSVHKGHVGHCMQYGVRHSHVERLCQVSTGRVAVQLLRPEWCASGWLLHTMYQWCLADKNMHEMQ